MFDRRRRVASPSSGRPSTDGIIDEQPQSRASAFVAHDLESFSRTTATVVRRDVLHAGRRAAYTDRTRREQYSAATSFTQLYFTTKW